MNIIILGPQGSGKSTQGKKLSEKLNIPYIAGGDIAREVRLEDSEDGKRARELNDQGKLIPSEILFNHLEKKISQPRSTNGFILDGVPRSEEQIGFLNDLLKKLRVKIDKVILFNLSDEEAIKRLSQQSQQQNRPDTTPEAIKQRLHTYHTQTEPLLDYYRNEGTLVEIDGRKSIDEVENRVWEAVQND